MFYWFLYKLKIEINELEKFIQNADENTVKDMIDKMVFDQKIEFQQVDSSTS